MPEADLTYYF